MKTTPVDVLFIVNPKAGTKAKGRIEEFINQELDKSIFKNIKVKFTEYKKHALELSQKATAEGIPLVVAVGGDGTVNEVATGLLNSNSCLGIIPMGSGNGLAYHLNIPINLKKALKLLNRFKTKKIDVIKVNENYSFNITGLGFDAHVSNVFDTFGKRGFSSYLRVVLKEYNNFVCPSLCINFNDQSLNVSPFVLALGNGSQYGNGAYIAPMANMEDGMLDLVIVEKPTVMQLPRLILNLFFKKIHTLNLTKHFKTKKIRITGASLLHLDGEPIICNKPIEIEIISLALNIATPY